MNKEEQFSQLVQFDDSNWVLRKLPISELKFSKISDGLNTRKPADVWKIQLSIRKNGLKYYPFVTANLEVLDGACRILAFKALGYEEIMCWVVDLDPERHLAFIIAANQRREKTKSESYKEALAFVPPPSQGKKGIGDRYDFAAKSAGKQFGGGNLRMFEEALKIHEQYPDAGLLKAFDIGILKGVNALLAAAEEVKKTHDDKNDAKKPITIPLGVPKNFSIYDKESWVMAEIVNESIQLTFTSPPYWDQRNYKRDKTKDAKEGEARVLGKEKTPEEYIANLREIMLEVYRVTKFRGSVFVNISDTYTCDGDNLIPELFCIMMAQIGFHKINTIPWVKKNNRTRGDEDRRLNPSWEYLFHFVKKVAANSKLLPDQKYLYQPFLHYPENKKIKVSEIGPRHNPDGSKTKPKTIVSKAFKRLQDFFDDKTFFDVIRTATSSADVTFLKNQYAIEHIAPFPLELPIYAILTCTQVGDLVLDTFMGSGTTAVASLLFDREAVGYEPDAQSHELSENRCTDVQIGLAELAKERSEAKEPVQKRA